LNIQESSLLSGGIETRYLSSVLSKDRQKLLKTYMMIMDDPFLLQNFDQSSENVEDDKILQAIIKEGLDENTDEIIKCI
jgi:hypothetical protein